MLDAPILNGDNKAPTTRGFGERARIEVPADINALQQSDKAQAIAWRHSTRVLTQPPPN